MRQRMSVQEDQSIMGTMITRRAIYLFATLVCVSAAASAQVQTQVQKKPPPAATKTLFQPNPVDLKAAYCRPVVASTISLYAKSLSADAPSNLHVTAKEQHDAATERRRRLEVYMLPRIDVVEPAGLLAAQARGKEDAESLSRFMLTCDAKCKNVADPQKNTSCHRQCSEGSEVVKRTRDCDDLSWLPLRDYDNVPPAPVAPAPVAPATPAAPAAPAAPGTSRQTPSPK